MANGRFNYWLTTMTLAGAALTACATPYDYPWAEPAPSVATITGESSLHTNADELFFDIVVDGPAPDRVELLVDGTVVKSRTDGIWEFDWVPPVGRIDQTFTVQARAVRDRIPINQTPLSNAVQARIDRVPPRIEAAASIPRIDVPVTNFWVKRPIQIHLTEPIDPATVDDQVVYVRRSDGSTVASTVQYFPGGNYIQLELAENPNGSETWTAFPTDLIRDPANNPLEVNVDSFQIQLPRWVDLDGLDVTNAASPRLAVSVEDDTQPLHLTWEDNDDVRTHVASYEGSWEPVGGTLGSGVVDARFPSVAVAFDGNPAFCWQEADELALRRWNADQWGSMGNMTIPLPVNGTRQAEMLIGTDRVPRIITTEAAVPSLWTFNGADWIQDVSSGHTCDSFPAVAVRDHLVSGCTNGSGALAVDSFDGVDWTAAPALATGDGAPALDVGIAVAGLAATEHPVVAWIESSGDLFVAAQVGANWTLLGGTLASGATAVSAAADAQGEIWVAWERPAGLTLAHWTGSVWESLDEDLASGAGAADAHLIVEADGRPAVVWQEGGRLEVRRYNSL